MEIDKKQVGQRIKQLRLSLGLTLEELGKKFNTSKATVYNWEVGRNLPNKDNTKEIASLGNITVNELLYGSKEAYVKAIIQEYCKENETQVNETALNKTIQQYPDKTTYEPAEGIIDFYTMFDSGFVEFAPMNKIIDIYKSVITDLEEKKANNDNFTKEDEQVLQYFKNYVSKNK